MKMRIVIVLCLSLIMNGFAVVTAQAAPCPMKSPVESPVQMPASQPMQHERHQAVMPDCCNDEDTATKTGRHCKHPNLCMPTGHLITVSVPVIESLLPTVRFTTITYASRPTLSPAPVWRPPALI